MKNIFKITTILILLLLTFTLASCGNEEETFKLLNFEIESILVIEQEKIQYN